jgi:hypothetical protein
MRWTSHTLACSLGMLNKFIKTNKQQTLVNGAHITSSKSCQRMENIKN